MENQTTAQNSESVYDGVEAKLDDIEAEIDRVRKEAQKNSRFRQIEDGKTAQLVFTSKVYKRVSKGTDDKGIPYTADKLDLELEEKVAEGKDAGKNKLFSVGAKNSIVRDILAKIKAGQKTLLISRKGTGKATKYELTSLEQ